MTRKSTFGSFTFVLHSHLPYVLSHGKWPHGSEWLLEAATETYIPLLDALNRLAGKGIEFKLTLGLTPVLCEMLADGEFADQLKQFLRDKIEEAKLNTQHFEEVGEAQFAKTGHFWQQWYGEVLESFTQKYEENLLAAFQQLQEDGYVEIITSAATHGYLPLLGTDESVEAQVSAGVANYRKHFGQAPRGFWMPECAYCPAYRWQSPCAPAGAEAVIAQDRKGVESFLAKYGLRYTIVDTHLFAGGATLGVYAERFPQLKRLFDHAKKQEDQNAAHGSPNCAYWIDTADINAKAKVAALARHERTSMQVWSADHGYPGNGAYLDFHKKYFPGGLRYWKVTSTEADLGEKEPYDRGAIEALCEEQATHFVSLVKEGLQGYQAVSSEAGFICCPYDTELFGHWWFEGVRWLEKVLEKLALDESVNLATGSEVLQEHPPQDAISLPEGSWGEGGFHHVWLNDDTVWTWREIYKRELQMQEMAQKYFSTQNLQLRAVLDQCAREVLLMESSDWQFLISTVAAADYAQLRCVEHLEAFDKLHELATKLAENQSLTKEQNAFLESIRQTDRVFEEVSFGGYGD